MFKFKISKTTVFQASALIGFALMAMSSSSNKEFNEGFREGYNAVTDAYSENTTQEMDSMLMTTDNDVAQFELPAK